MGGKSREIRINPIVNRMNHGVNEALAKVKAV